MSKKEDLLRQLLQAARAMIRGGLSQTTRQCGKPTCACHRDPSRRHGPHLYLTFRKDGKSRALYVAPEHTSAIRQAHAAWAHFWEIGCSLAELNLAEMQSRWQQPAPMSEPAKRPRARREHL